DALPDPLGEESGGAVAKRPGIAYLARIDSQQIAQAERAKVGEFRPLNEVVDQLRALVRRLVSGKCSDLVGTRKSSERVERYAAQEFGVCAKGRGQDIQALEIVEHVLIDGIVRRLGWI